MSGWGGIIVNFGVLVASGLLITGDEVPGAELGGFKHGKSIEWSERSRIKLGLELES